MVAEAAAKCAMSVRRLTPVPNGYSISVNWHIRQANVRGNSVARKLGGRKTLGRDVNSDNELIAIVREGLPAEALDHVLAELAEGEIPQASVYRLIGSGRTLQRKRSQDLKLSALESDRLARLARMLVRTEEVFGDAERSRRWLMEPNRALGGQLPLELLDSDTGTVAVDRILVRIDHGVFS
jgi:putative toxin-antitoxin system antitoxin component (TIGR02293 family)